MNVYNNDDKSAWKDEAILNEVERKLVSARLHETLNGYKVMRNQMKEGVDSASLSGMLNYLKKLLILDSTVQSSRFKYFCENENYKKHMIIDSQTLQNLEILESDKSLVQKNMSLYDNINKATGAPGKRMLRTWLTLPLMNIQEINQRLDSIEFLALGENKNFIHSFKEQVKKTGDYERSLARMYSYGVNLNDEQKQVVMFEDVSGNRLRELRTLFSQMEAMVDFLMRAKLDFSNPKARRMRQLITPYEFGLEEGELGLLRSFKAEI